jgi:hypothetical protein
METFLALPRNFLQHVLATLLLATTVKGLCADNLWC